ncbi:hypothetical protein [Sphingomonas bacterium]|uniref:hypothetical protein n=1 Tax=Sphingomonas bacterium TaxID=1895847 RepID=UPI001576BFFC|nr:hypothetical protein [Sphingomonas bacterium]
MRIRLIAATALLGAIAGCGSQAELQPAPGDALPVAPRGALRQPSPEELLTASKQARPQRSDELLTNSETRRTDEFDLPPGNVN